MPERATTIVLLPGRESTILFVYSLVQASSSIKLVNQALTCAPTAVPTVCIVWIIFKELVTTEPASAQRRYTHDTSCKLFPNSRSIQSGIEEKEEVVRASNVSSDRDSEIWVEYIGHDYIYSPLLLTE